MATYRKVNGRLVKVNEEKEKEVDYEQVKKDFEKAFTGMRSRGAALSWVAKKHGITEMDVSETVG